MTIDHSTDGIGIICISGHFPKANSVTDFCDIIIHGKNCISEVPKDRCDWR
ncbi:beta-ketoacyl synthase N-terminal-like domain-containing protein [Bacillus spizizenii]|uniref:beta-ketoacyl synthase N-terminal-like domain-containing protein n=1 Tax=Bacillus spizizenii TaxID=96241 RepID=UPI0036F28091